MRTIKFRAWDKSRTEYIYFGLFDISTDESGRLWIGDYGKRYEEDLKIEQYTDLKDKNGKEIYEGDIVRWDDASGGEYWRVAYVIWGDGQWVFRILPKQCVGYEASACDFGMGNFIYCPDISKYGNVLEVIGNIHENEDLL